MEDKLDIVALLHAAHSLERSVCIALMYSGLRLPQFRLLDCIEREDEATVTQISRLLGITRATASVMANDLIRSGILAVEENPADRRSFFLRLTAVGRNKLNVARSDLAVLQAKLANRYPGDMVRMLNAFSRA